MNSEHKPVIIVEIFGRSVTEYTYDKTLRDGSRIFKGFSTRNDKTGRGLYSQVRLMRDGELRVTLRTMTEHFQAVVVTRHRLIDIADKELRSQQIKDTRSEFYTTPYAVDGDVVVVKPKNAPAIGLRYTKSEDYCDFEQFRSSCTRLLFEGGEYALRVGCKGVVTELVAKQTPQQITFDRSPASCEVENICVFKGGATRGDVLEACAEMDGREYEQVKPNQVPNLIYSNCRGGYALIVKFDTLRADVRTSRWGWGWREQKTLIYGGELVLHQFKTLDEVFAAIDQYYSKGFTKLQTKKVTSKCEDKGWYDYSGVSMKHRPTDFGTTAGGNKYRHVHNVESLWFK